MPANERRENIKSTANLEDFLTRYVEAYDFTAKPELVKQIAREFYQAQKSAQRKS